MQDYRHLPVFKLLIIVAVLAVAGGLTTVLVTSPLSFNLARVAILQSIFTPESTATLSLTPTPTWVPGTPTVQPATTSSLSITVPLATSLPTAQQTGTPRPTARARGTATTTATGPVLAADVRALAFVTGRAGAMIVRVRELPNGTRVIAALQGGTVVQVLFGRSVVDGLEWLPVRLSNGQVGWVAGYLLTITLERPAGSDTAESPATQADTSTPEPFATPSNSTGQAPPHIAPTATSLSPGPTATPSHTATAINPPAQTQTSPPWISTVTPTPPVPPTATNTPVPTTGPPSDTPVPTVVPPSNTPVPTTVPPSDTPVPTTMPPSDTPFPTAVPPSDTPAATP